MSNFSLELARADTLLNHGKHMMELPTLTLPIQSHQPSNKGSIMEEADERVNTRLRNSNALDDFSPSPSILSASANNLRDPAILHILLRALTKNRLVLSGKNLVAGLGRVKICGGKLWQLGNSHYSRRKIMRGKQVSGRVLLVLCVASFLAGSLFCTSRMTWTTQLHSPNKEADHQFPIISSRIKKLEASSSVAQDKDCDHKRKLVEGKSEDDITAEMTKTHQAIQSLDKTISKLEMEIAAARASQRLEGQLKLDDGASNNNPTTHPKQKAFVFIGINTAFSSQKRRKTVRETWMPRGEKLKKLEKEKGIVIRFVIGQSAMPGGMLDRAIEAEEAKHNDFLRLNHAEGYHELSTKTRLYFSTAISIWDAEFYVKVDDDIHVNLGMLATTLARHRSKPRIYIGCMKSGPVLFQKGVKYHEPEYWKFGEEGNKYFRHATGQIYAISKDLATYISNNLPILHRYANEDVSLGSWFIGLEVEHIDDRSMCCGTSPDCERRAQAGNVCVASFDWKCSGICNSAERMKDVHNLCGEESGAVWNVEL